MKMHRIRRADGVATVTISHEVSCDEDELQKVVDKVKLDVARNLDTLMLTAMQFDEVNLDKAGNLSCKNKAK